MRGIRSSEFDSLVEPHRGSLRLHCYRLTGSLDVAEDLVQETFLRAWRRRDTLADRDALRGWLYRIATNAFLDQRQLRRHRTLPLLVTSAADPTLPPAPPAGETEWLQPFPNALLAEALPADERNEPEARYTTLESVSLAFLAALQLLTPRERVALLLCDVLDWSARETADCLAWTLSSVNSALHRARARLAQRYPTGTPAYWSAELTPPDPRTQLALERYVRAWETDDVHGLVALLREDATLAMPPSLAWYAGRDAIVRFLSATVLTGATPGLWRLEPSGANAQPAFLLYRRDAAGAFTPAGVQVLTLNPHHQFAAITVFLDPRWVTRLQPNRARAQRAV